MNAEPDTRLVWEIREREQSLTIFPSELNRRQIIVLQRAYRTLLSQRIAALPPTSTRQEFEASLRESMGEAAASGSRGREAMQLAFNFREERREVMLGQIIKTQAKIDKLDHVLTLIDQPDSFREEMESIIATVRPLKPARRG